MKHQKQNTDREEKKALEKLVKDTFCNKKSVVDCAYKERIWCPKTCGYYQKLYSQIKYWNH